MNLKQRSPDKFHVENIEVPKRKSFKSIKEGKYPRRFVRFAKREPYMMSTGKREPYGFGIGKREPYRFGVGKRKQGGNIPTEKIENVKRENYHLEQNNKVSEY